MQDPQGLERLKWIEGVLFICCMFIVLCLLWKLKKNTVKLILHTVDTKLYSEVKASDFCSPVLTQHPGSGFTCRRFFIRRPAWKLFRATALSGDHCADSGWLLLYWPKMFMIACADLVYWTLTLAGDAEIKKIRWLSPSYS